MPVQNHTAFSKNSNFQKMFKINQPHNFNNKSQIPIRSENNKSSLPSPYKNCNNININEQKLLDREKLYIIEL